MDTDNLQDVATALATTIRATLRTELTSIWLPIQIAAIVVSALLAIAIAALLRRRFDLTSATMGWPAYLRKIVRVLSDNFPVLVFILVDTVVRAGIQTWAEHPRTYLLHVANNLATAWVVIAILACLIRNAFINRVVAVTAWTIAALSIVG